MAQRRRQNTNPKRQDRGNGNTQYLDDFIKLFDYLQELRTNQSTGYGEEEDTPENRRDARKYVEEKGLEAYLATPPGADVDVNSEEFVANKSRYIQHGYDLLLRDINQNIGKFLDANIDNVLDGISPEHLERLASEENIKRVGDSKKYAGLMEKVAQYNGFRDLSDRFERGEVEEKEIVPFYELVGQELATKYKKQLEDEGADEEYIENIVAIAIDTARLGGYKKEYVKSAIKGLADKTKNEIEGTGLNLANYVKDALKKLRKEGGPQDTAIARQLIYAACQMSKEGSN
jgi:hypothetical protein